MGHVYPRTPESWRATTWAVPESGMADTKNWTWVLERPCPECGFDARLVERDAIAPTTRSVTQHYVTILTDGDRDRLRRRPRPDVWSALEYCCHIRDVFRVMHERLRSMLDEDGPHFANWDQDATAVEDDYGGQDPVQVRADLAIEGYALADVLDIVQDDQWDRPGYRSDGSTFTVESLGRYLLHDVVHHVWDLEVGVPLGAG
jgi:hypothetical protein